MDNCKTFLSSFTPEEVSAFMRTENPALSEDVLSAIVSHKIDGAFLELTEEYLREVAPILGDRIKLKKIISGVQLNSSAVGSSNLLPVSQYTYIVSAVIHDSYSRSLPYIIYMYIYYSYACIIIM